MNAVAAELSAAAIAVARLTKRFGDFVAVDNVDLHIRRGELFSLLGPSGCGKTTLLRLIAGLEDPSAGSIRLEGRDVSALPPYRRNVNTVFQSYALFPHLTVFENVAFGPRTRGLPRQEVQHRVAAMLELVRMQDLSQRYPDALSGGERQRVALARALVNQPTAVLLDEPLSALDRTLRQTMQAEIKRIQRETNLTFLMVTHDQEEALALSDRVAVMRSGKIEQLGTTADIYQRPASAFVASFVGTANLVRVVVEQSRPGIAQVRFFDGAAAQIRCDDMPPAIGEKVCALVRPEAVQLADSRADGPYISVPAVVRDTVFQGPLLRCVLEPPDGSELIADLRQRHQVAPRLGARVWAYWHPEDMRLLRRPPQ